MYESLILISKLDQIAALKLTQNLLPLTRNLLLLFLHRGRGILLKCSVGNLEAAQSIDTNIQNG